MTRYSSAAAAASASLGFLAGRGAAFFSAFLAAILALGFGRARARGFAAACAFAAHGGLAFTADGAFGFAAEQRFTVASALFVQTRRRSFVDRLDRDDALVFRDAHELHALRVAAGLADAFHRGADGLTAVGDEHDFIAGLDHGDAHDGAVAVAALDEDDAFTAAVLLAELLEH